MVLSCKFRLCPNFTILITASSKSEHDWQNKKNELRAKSVNS